MATYVLIHGALAGGWMWKRVIPLLREAGHEAFAPSLTGLGERAHLANPQTGLDTHIQDVLAVLESEDLHNVILVGHSWGGMILPGVADRASDRLRHLVYLDATVPQPGQSFLDCASPEYRAWIEETMQSSGDGWRFPTISLREFVTSEEDVNWVDSRTAAQPYKSLQDPVHFDSAIVNALPRTFIACIGEQAHGGERPPEAEGMNYLELSTTHLAMVTAPRELADMLLALA